MPGSEGSVMGWLFYTDKRVQSYADERAEIARLCTFENGGGRKTQLLNAAKVGSTWYAAAQVSNTDGTQVKTTDYEPEPDGSIIFGAVFLTKYDDGCWGYKDMDESMGPCESRAPKSILKCLSKLKNPDSYANDWRKRCEAWSEIPTYKDGDRIRLAKPVQLTDGTSCQEIEATTYRSGARNMRCYRISETGNLVRLSKGSLIGSELVTPAVANGSDILAEFFKGR